MPATSCAPRCAGSNVDHILLLFRQAGDLTEGLVEQCDHERFKDPDSSYASLFGNRRHLIFTVS